MNILHRFTRKSLLANRSRTLVTIIGIILSYKKSISFVLLFFCKFHQ